MVQSLKPILKKIRENYEVNIFGMIELTQLVIKKMISKNKGRILMLSSIIADMPLPWLGIYSSTKAAIKNLTICLSKELKQLDSNVKAIIIEPGAYHTGSNQVMLENKYDDDDSVFKDIREKIRDKENLIFNTLESHDLKSIADKIVEAVEDEKPKLIYMAPFTQSLVQKIYTIAKK